MSLHFSMFSFTSNVLLTLLLFHPCSLSQTFHPNSDLASPPSNSFFQLLFFLNHESFSSYSSTSTLSYCSMSLMSTDHVFLFLLLSFSSLLYFHFPPPSVLQLAEWVRPSSLRSNIPKCGESSPLSRSIHS